MNISDQHYFLDRSRHDLALRMIGHEARTCTIRACTGLSADRIRKLHKSYVLQSPERIVSRHRGRTPHQAAYFSNTLRLHFESSLLANAFGTFGLPGLASADATAVLHFGQRFCDAYETHCQLLRPARLSFEHAWLLFHCLHRIGLLQLARCRVCDGRHLHDPLRAPRHGCPTCKMKSGRPRRQEALPPAPRPK